MDKQNQIKLVEYINFLESKYRNKNILNIHQEEQYRKNINEILTINYIPLKKLRKPRTKQIK